MTVFSAANFIFMTSSVHVVLYLISVAVKMYLSLRYVCTIFFSSISYIKDDKNILLPLFHLRMDLLRPSVVLRLGFLLLALLSSIKSETGGTHARTCTASADTVL
jgi:hypothetical protein